MTIGTQLAIAIDRASNRTQARILSEFEQTLGGNVKSPFVAEMQFCEAHNVESDVIAVNQCRECYADNAKGRAKLDVNRMPVDCLMFLIAEPCWMEE